MAHVRPKPPRRRYQRYDANNPTDVVQVILPTCPPAAAVTTAFTAP